VYGIIEGVTEWLPVSSTGHLILLEDILTLQVGTQVHPLFASEFWELFLVTVQLGAIFAVVTLYHRRLFPPIKDREACRASAGIWSRVIVGCIPAGIAGVAADAILTRICGKDMDGLFYNGAVVAAMLMLYGVLFIIAERMRKGKTENSCDVAELSLGKCFGVGLFQVLSLVPGTSRSGACILGGMLLGLSRKTAAELSFFMAVPVMLGACSIKALGFARFMLQNGLRMPAPAVFVLLVACAAAYVTSRISIRFLIDFVSRRGFAPFGVYRILLGAAVLIYYFI
jgi:undecaprenyl-diphosphatase